MVEYRLALLQQPSNAVLRAKTGAAALHAGALADAAENYKALAKAGRAHMGEAVDGLERVVRAAVDARDRQAFAAAVAALRDVAPARAGAAVGQDVGWLLGDEAPGKEMLDLISNAAAHAPDGGRQDSLVYVYGLGLWRLDRCDDALPAFESVLRRQRVASVSSGARRGAAQCALQLGNHALIGGQLADAETWFTRAASDLEDESLSRAAYLGLGDVRRGKGDLTGAAEAYQRVLTGARTGDTLAQAAAVRLNAMAQAGTGGP
jgi:tetratricopeptide (TPR) repeat protein